MTGEPMVRATLALSTLLAICLFIWPIPTQAAGPAQVADQPPPTLDQILQRFDDSVFFNVPGNNKRVLAKWQDDIRVGIASDPGVPVAVVSKLFSVLTAVADLSHHRIVVTTQNVNFFVMFSNNLDLDLKKYRPAFRGFFRSDDELNAYYERFKATKAGCNIRVAIADDYTHAITRAAAIVMASPSEPTPSESCMYNVVFTGMGFVGRNAHLIAPPSSAESTTIDASALAILYRNEISSGATEDQARPIITKIYHAARHE